MIFRCTYCGVEFEDEAELVRHTREQHKTDVQEIDASDLEEDTENESITEAVLTDYITDVQESGYEGSSEAESFTGGSAAGGSTAYGEGSATTTPSPDVAQIGEPDEIDLAGDPAGSGKLDDREPVDNLETAGGAETRRAPKPPPERHREKTLGDLLDPRDEYRCEQCGAVFPHREDLDRHRWIEHGPKRAAS